MTTHTCNITPTTTIVANYGIYTCDCGQNWAIEKNGIYRAVSNFTARKIAEEVKAEQEKFAAKIPVPLGPKPSRSLGQQVNAHNAYKFILKDVGPSGGLEETIWHIERITGFRAPSNNGESSKYYLSILVLSATKVQTAMHLTRHGKDPIAVIGDTVDVSTFKSWYGHKEGSVPDMKREADKCYTTRMNHGYEVIFQGTLHGFDLYV